MKKEFLEAELSNQLFNLQRLEKKAFDEGFKRGYEAGKQLHEEDCVKICAEEQKIEELEQGEPTEEEKKEMEEGEREYYENIKKEKFIPASPKDFEEYPEGIDYASAHGFYLGNDGEWVC